MSKKPKREHIMESVETLLRYRKFGIPLMPLQIEYLQSRGHARYKFQHQEAPTI